MILAQGEISQENFLPVFRTASGPFCSRNIIRKNDGKAVEVFVFFLYNKKKENGFAKEKFMSAICRKKAYQFTSHK